MVIWVYSVVYESVANFQRAGQLCFVNYIPIRGVYFEVHMEAQFTNFQMFSLYVSNFHSGTDF